MLHNSHKWHKSCLARNTILKIQDTFRNWNYTTPDSDEYAKAEEVFARAYEVSDEDADVRERWEDAQLRRLRKKISQTEDEQTKQKLRQEFNRKELEIYQNRCRRYPNNLAFKYDLGLRYQRSGQYNEAIKEFQLARNDPRRKGLCMLALGRCFEKVKQYRLAMSHYESAIEEIPGRDAANKKDALHRAGKLSLALEDLEAAEKHLTNLAGLDFGYRDVSEILEKIAALRKKE